MTNWSDHARVRREDRKPVRERHIAVCCQVARHGEVACDRIDKAWGLRPHGGDDRAIVEIGLLHLRVRQQQAVIDELGGRGVLLKQPRIAKHRIADVEIVAIVARFGDEERETRLVFHRVDHIHKTHR